MFSDLFTKERKNNLKRKSQNLVEFVFILSLLLVILFGILEFGMYYRNVNVVEDIATEIAVTGSKRLIFSTMTSVDITNTTNAGFNSAAKAAIDVVTRRRGALAIPTLTFNYTNKTGPWGTRPYAFYQLDSTQTRNINGVNTPIVTILFDYRNVNKNGLSVQLIYQYRTLLVGAQFPNADGSPIVIIPRDIPIRSTMVKQYLMY